MTQRDLKRRSPGCLCLLLCLLTATAPAGADTQLRLMSFNAWGGGQNDGKTTEQTVAAIRASGADIVGLQESRAELPPCRNHYCPPHGPSIAAELAHALGFYYHDQHSSTDTLWANAILSRFPILSPTPRDLGVSIDVAGRMVVLFNIHPNDYPYQPYQLLHIPYEAAPYISTSAEAVRYARRTRGDALKMLQQDLAAAGKAVLIIVTGDFNEPSDRDWTERAVAAGRYPVAVPWPLTSALEAAGFVDAFRTAHPDEIAKPGFTWPSATATDSPGTGYEDRIDFIFVRGPRVRVSRALVVGEAVMTADIVVKPWPSDHRAVVAEIDF